MSNTQLSKIYILDSVRGVVAVIVALYHFIHFSNHHGPLFAEDNAVLAVIDPFLHGSVCIFFIISGYVIYLHLERHDFQLKDYGKFIWKRFLRLHIPLVCCLVVIVAVNAAFHNYLGLPIEIEFDRFLANITLTASFFDYEWYNPIFWTLSIEFQFYFVIALLFVLIKKRPFDWLFILAALLIPLNYFVETTPTVAHFGSYFIIGIAMYQFHQKRFSEIYLMVLIIICVVDCILNQPEQYYVIPIASIPIMLFVNTRVRFLEFTGKISYSFYLLHGLLGGWFLYFTARYATESWQKIGLIVLAILISYIGSYPFYRLIEKTSFRISRKIKYKK